MTQGLHERIRERAYLLWEREGGKHGEDWDYWLQAEREILTEDDAPAPATAAKAPAKRAPRSTKATAAKKEPAKTAAKAPAKTTTRKKSTTAKTAASPTPTAATKPKA